MESSYLKNVSSSILGLAELATTYSSEGSIPKTFDDVLSALSNFMECVRYINTRRAKSNMLSLDSEEAVQDAIYLMLRPWVTDLIPENPTDKSTNRFLIKDFLIPSLNTVIEAKFLRDKKHGKSIEEEINDDIETYRYHPNCKSIIFFIYDRDVLIPDRSRLEKHIQASRTYATKSVKCYAVIRP